MAEIDKKKLKRDIANLQAQLKILEKAELKLRNKFAAETDPQKKEELRNEITKSQVQIRAVRQQIENLREQL